MTVDQEVEQSLDIFLISTNFDFPKYGLNDLTEFEQVRHMYKLLAMLSDYIKESFLRDKITAAVSVYTGQMII